MSGIQLKNWQKMKIRINTEQAKIKSPGHIVSKSLRMSHLTHLTTLRAKRATFIDISNISNFRRMVIFGELNGIKKFIFAYCVTASELLTVFKMHFIVRQASRGRTFDAAVSDACSL